MAYQIPHFYKEICFQLKSLRVRSKFYIHHEVIINCTFSR